MSGESGEGMVCNALIFDLDGVLVDSAACVEHHWRRWAERHGLDLGEILKVAHGRRTAETVSLVAPDLDADAEAAELAQSEEVDTKGIYPIAGARELLRSLPHDAWAVATSGTAQTALTRINCIGLPRPRIFVSADDVSRGKPDPEPYELAARQLRVPPAECVVVEDSPTGVDSARATGMRVIGICSTLAQGELMQADILLQSLDELAVTVRGREEGPRLSITFTRER